MGTKPKSNFLSTVLCSAESNHKQQHQPLGRGSHWASSGGFLGPRGTQNRESPRGVSITGITGSGASESESCSLLM